jgi:hypothetical protein
MEQLPARDIAVLPRRESRNKSILGSHTDP